VLEAVAELKPLGVGINLQPNCVFLNVSPVESLQHLTRFLRSAPPSRLNIGAQSNGIRLSTATFRVDFARADAPKI
jgi:hypothetical protein